MSKKHLYDSAEGLVLNSLRGAVALNPALKLHEPSKTVYVQRLPVSPTSHSAHGRTKKDAKRVAVISGGGAGHEPAHAGYTGKGMLAACVSGDVFASPSAKQILKAIQLASESISSVTPSFAEDVANEQEERADVLAIINNYTGDRLNFGLALEKARALLGPKGVNVDSVVVADDVSLLKSNGNGLVGPRGLGANILVCKVLGALADSGARLEVVKVYGDALVGNLVSLGVGLEHCHVPGRVKDVGPGLGDDECEIGLGLHNEPGAMKAKLEKEPGSFLDRMVEMLLDSKEGLRRECIEGGVVLFINNLGGMSQLEMGAVVQDVTSRLAGLNIELRRIYCSSYMTSLNAPGFSISLVNVRGLHNSFIGNAKYNDIFEDLLAINLEGLLDAPTDALAWVGARTSWETTKNQGVENVRADPDDTADLGASHFEGDRSGIGDDVESISATRLKSCIREACLRVLSVERELTEYDTIVGDGDCGETFARGANAILSHLDGNKLSFEGRSYTSIMLQIADILEDSMGGTIGALLAIFMNGLSASLQKTHNVQHVGSPWREVLPEALHTLSAYTPARIGDRTIIDALSPFCSSLRSGKTLQEAVESARIGAEDTRGMKPSLGRATYSTSTSDSSSALASSHGLPPDPGAWGIVAILEGLLAGMEGA
ncbi:DAK1/DegV-like protein [Agrocybe pediades]|nr:DAK1/DegV-like protein [Agrocybe pediades]